MGIGEVFARKHPHQDKHQQAPVDLPEGSWISFPRNPAFTARDEDLQGLARVLLATGEENQSSSRLAVITGPEGIGKSQLALEFCYRYGPQFERIHWIDCQHENTIAVQVTLHGHATQLPEWPEKGTGQLTATLKAWKTARQLLILDHIISPEELPAWINELENSSILVTSRTENWPEPNLAVLPLGPLTTPDAVAVLRELAPRLRKVKETDLEQLAVRLGGNPLALHLAGSFLDDRSSISVKNYQTDLEKAASSLSPALQTWSQNSTALQPTALAAAFDLSVRQLDQPAMRIFLAARLCAPEVCIPMDLLLEASGLSPKEKASFELSLEKISFLGLLTWTEEGLAIQTSLSEIPTAEESLEENQTEPDDLAQFCKAAAALNYTDYKTKPARKAFELVQHLQATTPQAESNGLKTAGSMWDGLGYLLWVLGENDKARTCFEKAIALDEINYSAIDYRIVQEYIHLGQVLYDQYDYKAARVQYQKALTIAEKAYAANHPVIADCSNRLGQVLLEIGDTKEARSCFERALSIHEKAYGFGPKHPEVAFDASNLGKALESLGDVQQARALYERALEINESIFVYGREHPQIAKDLTNLGRVLRALGDLQGARTCFERVVNISEKIYGPEHAETASALSNLARTLQDLGSLSEARGCYERVLSIDENLYGSEHIKTVVDLQSLAIVLRAMNDLMNARKCFERALAIEEKIHYAEHPNVATNLHNLGRVMQDMGDLKSAQVCFERALEIDKKNYGPVHPYVAADINNLGSILQDLKDLEGAERCFEEALAIDEKSYGENHPNTARDVNNLGSVLKAQGDLPGARSAFERALKIFESVLGPEHPKTRVVRANLKGVLRRME